MSAHFHSHSLSWSEKSSQLEPGWGWPLARKTSYHPYSRQTYKKVVP
jgi:hypothetical protein